MKETNLLQQNIQKEREREEIRFYPPPGKTKGEKENREAPFPRD